jgi:starch synthase (maltosyl-transferring)
MMALPKDGRARAVIAAVRPEVDGGSFPVKRTVGEAVRVEADVFGDGHDTLCCLLRHRPAGTDHWIELPMAAVGNDRWQAQFQVAHPGRHEYTVIAWVDRFLTWRHDLVRRQDAADIAVALLVGAALVDAAAELAGGESGACLHDWATQLRSAETPEAGRSLAQGEGLAILMAAFGERHFVAEYPRVLEVVVETERARFSSWYELFPRSCVLGNETHGTFAGVIKQLPDIAAMGFDVLYLPPIHPIGRAYRKGPNNSLTAGPNDPGSPWAIGAAEGGHRDIHPELGSPEDFRRLVTEARAQGIEVALDIAF